MQYTALKLVIFSKLYCLGKWGVASVFHENIWPAYVTCCLSQSDSATSRWRQMDIKHIFSAIFIFGKLLLLYDIVLQNPSDDLTHFWWHLFSGWRGVKNV